MKTAVKAIWYHYASTEDEPLHQFCPPGNTSWCKWQKDQVEGSKTFEPKKVASVVMEEIKPIFDALADEELLEKVLKGLSQNPNESLNHMVWNFCPKAVFAGPETVNTACALAVMLFNGGAHTLEKVLTGLNFSVGQYCKAGLEVMDQRRVYASAQKATAEEKLNHQKRHQDRKRKVDQNGEKEGTTYESGAFGS